MMLVVLTTGGCNKDDTEPTPKPSVISVTGVTVKSATSIEQGKTETLTATVVPADATDKSVVWDSSDKTVATVSGGVVTAVKAGTAIITVNTNDGSKTASCTVTVTQPSGNLGDFDNVEGL